MTRPDLPSWAGEYVAAVEKAGDDVDAGLAVAADYGARLPIPGAGDTATRWALLAAAGRIDLTAARVLEAHSDALAILDEAGETAPAGTWGVFAAEAPGTRVDATTTDETVTLTGTKPWCSLADRLDHALVTAHVGDERQLFAVDLRRPSVRVEPSAGWVARGLPHVISTSVTFVDTPARPVGGPGWYLHRPGFAWGGIGVAACWLGGTLGLFDSLRRWARTHPGDLADLHLGSVDAWLHAAEASMAGAARQVDAGAATGPAGALLALRVRAQVAETAERTLRQVGHALGPAALAFDEMYARRAADLELYVRQHHGERDLAALGAAVRARSDGDGAT